MVCVAPLALVPSVSQLLAYAQNHPHSLLLDSADQSHARSRYSYFLYSPSQTFENQNPLSVIEKFQTEAPIEKSDFFCGGIAGFLAFEAARYWPDFSHISFKKNERADVVLGFYPFSLVIDHHSKTAFLASSFLKEADLQLEKENFEKKMDSRLVKLSLWERGNDSKCDISSPQGPNFEAYSKKISRIQEYLKAGDVYQINYTEKFTSYLNGDAASLYLAIRQKNPVPYGAFYNSGKGNILSFSPECFMETREREIATYPIKGTVGRSHEKSEDDRLQGELKASSKDKAEHVMIVDLERNDLGKICKTGSVAVSPLFGVESFSHVHHLVSRVSGILKEGIGFKEILEALFPGGSITGAPKRRAVEIIAELEENPRFVYTGALGFWGTGGLSVLNIPIRTLYVEGEKVTGYAGGGIVVDSTAQKEYEEMILKINSVLSSHPEQSEGSPGDPSLRSG